MQSSPGERFTMREALNVVDGWLALPNIALLSPGEEHWPLFRQVLWTARRMVR